MPGTIHQQHAKQAATCLLQHTGAIVDINDCYTTTATLRNNQRWFSDSQGRLRSYVNPFRCLDIVGGSTAEVRQSLQLGKHSLWASNKHLM